MNGPFMFGLHPGHLKHRARMIAAKHGAEHVNHTEPGGRKRGWFFCENLGEPFNSNRAKRVLAEIEAAGGFKALEKKG